MLIYNRTKNPLVYFYILFYCKTKHCSTHAETPWGFFKSSVHIANYINILIMSSLLNVEYLFKRNWLRTLWKWLYTPFFSIDEWKSCYCYVTMNNNTYENGTGSPCQCQREIGGKTRKTYFHIMDDICYKIDTYIILIKCTYFLILLERLLIRMKYIEPPYI